MSLLISFNSSALEHRLAVLQPSRARQKERTLPSHQEDSEQGLFRSFSPHLGRMKQRSISGIKQPTLAPQKVSFFEKNNFFSDFKIEKDRDTDVKKLDIPQIITVLDYKMWYKAIKAKNSGMYPQGILNHEHAQDHCFAVVVNLHV